jgi:type 1 glutamine amidotransferase/nicotinamidase-related amidase
MRSWSIIFLVVVSSAWSSRNAWSGDDASLNLFTRSRELADAGEFDCRYKTVQWDGEKTAIVVCDMWDQHWCPSATRRVAEMAPRMNEVLKAARRRGVLIIHSPSGTLAAYENTPQRRLASSAPAVQPARPLRGWCHLDPEKEPPLPIDDSDGGCAEREAESRQVWQRQIDTIEIMPGDAITDNQEAYYLMEQRGIENVILMGVHTNMCVLGRPFGIRQLVYQGKNVLLMRDMTDAMYNPARKPFVSHVRGTELVIEHIEKYWCPTVTSSDFLGGPAFRFAEDKRPHVSFLVSDDHYDADKTLPEFAQMLREKQGFYCTVMHGQGEADIPATDELQDTDCLVLFIRRLALPTEQLDAVRTYLKSGKSLVALRTASHAFDVRGNSTEGFAEWRDFDPEVLGGSYHNHGPNEDGTDVKIVPSQLEHPVMAGVHPSSWHSVGSLYFTSPIADDATLLMSGSLGDREEPLTWVRRYHDGKVFYSALGHPEDFQVPAFRKMLLNAICWALSE